MRVGRRAGAARWVLPGATFSAYGEKPRSRALRPPRRQACTRSVKALIFKASAGLAGKARHGAHPHLTAEGFKECGDHCLVFLGCKGAGAVDDASAGTAELKRVLEETALRLPKSRAKGFAGSPQVAALGLAFGGARSIQQNPIKAVVREGGRRRRRWWRRS